MPAEYSSDRTKYPLSRYPLKFQTPGGPVQFWVDPSWPEPEAQRLVDTVEHDFDQMAAVYRTLAAPYEPPSG